MSVAHKSEDLVLRRATRADDAALRALNGTVFPNNPKQRPAITQWQWWENPFGEPLAWVWEEDGRVVAQTVAYCAPGTIAGRSCTLLFSVDSAVSASHQGRQLFTRLWSALARDAIEHGHLLGGYPNENSWRAVSRVGWIEVTRPRVYALVRSDQWLAARLRLPRLLARGALTLASRPRRPRRRLTATVLETVPDGLDDLWSSLAPSWASGVARSHPWWQWRYGSHPDRPYTYLEVREGDRCVAAAAVRARHELVGGRFHCLLELLALDDDAARAVVLALAEGAMGDADGIAVAAAPGSPLQRAASAAGMRQVPARLHRPVRFGVVPHPTLLPDPAAVRWSTAWGDLDHF